MRIRWQLLTLSLVEAASTVSLSGCDFEAQLFASLQCMAGDEESCKAVFLDDSDFDGLVDSIDNCQSVSNPDQKDLNHNGIGDACEGSASPTPTSPVAPSLATIALRHGAKRARVRFTIAKASSGGVTSSGGTYSGSASTASGSFRGPRNSSGLPPAGPLRGTWRAALSFKLDSHAHTGSTKGLVVLKIKGRGKLCLSFSTRYGVRKGALTVKGRFHSAGGTRAASHVIASGRYADKHVRGQTWSMNLTGRVRSGKAKIMSAACRAV